VPWLGGAAGYQPPEHRPRPHQTTIIAPAESFDRASITDVQSGSTRLTSPEPRSIPVAGRLGATIQGGRWPISITPADAQASRPDRLFATGRERS
jgi:hypothetical protein